MFQEQQSIPSLCREIDVISIRMKSGIACATLCHICKSGRVVGPKNIFQNEPSGKLR